MYWFYGMVAVGFFGMLFAGSLRYFVSFNLLMLIVWYFTLAKKQINLVDATFGKNYSQKSFGKPLFVGIGCLVAALIFVEGLHSLGRGGSEPVAAGEDSATDAGVVTEKAEDPVDLFNRGVAYANGDGVTEDLAEAVRCYRKAADLGYSDAMNNLGLCYEQGEGVSLDYVQAVSWYRKAAEAGYSRGMLNLGVCYDNGTGVAKDEVEAVKWYRKSAEAGDARGMVNLGACYEYGTGVAKDEVEAVKWYRKAAEAGEASGMANLGLC
jgi:TPR repeat protein